MINQIVTGSVFIFEHFMLFIFEHFIKNNVIEALTPFYRASYAG